MSLTSLLSERDVRERFRQEFSKPRLSEKRELLAAPRSKRYSLVGTAFDYLLRFYLQRLNRGAIHRPWIAEAGLRQLELRSPSYEVFDVDAGKFASPFRDTTLEKARHALRKAREAHARYLSFGKLTDELLKAVIYLAQLDVVFRCGYVDDNMGVTHREDLADLRKLISLVKPDLFVAKRRCLLNPDFGDASLLVGGADADFVIDEMLVDIKTVKNFELTRDHFNQLIGYLALHELPGLTNRRRPRSISAVAIYYARHAHLEVFETARIVNTQSFPTFLKWFRNRAAQSPRQQLPDPRRAADRPLSRSRGRRSRRRTAGSG
jgi:hypothetical protein